MATVVLIGTLDTKGPEYTFLRDRLEAEQVEVVVVDTGVLGAAQIPADVPRERVAEAAGTDLGTLVGSGDRGTSVDAMARGAAEVALGLYRDGQLDAVLAVGGSGGTSIATRAMRALPVGVPKFMVSTVTAGDTRPYVGDRDVTLMASVVDISGLNRISARVLRNAAAAAAGMARAHAGTRADSWPEGPVVGATMFGVTTPCVEAARARLEDLGYEVLVFHATGTGGAAMEALARSGELTAVLDVTTTELADELVGGVCTAGPERLETAGELGLPQVVSLGALDMANFGPLETVPERYASRHLHRHNAAITLLRTSAEECAELGRRIATKLNATRGPVSLFVPLRGVSSVSTDGQVFHDPAADEMLFDALRSGLAEHVQLVEVDTHINDPAFATAMADRLHALLETEAGYAKEKTASTPQADARTLRGRLPSSPNSA